MSNDKDSSVSKLKFNIRQIEKEFMQHIILPISYKLARGTVDERMVVLADCHHNSCPEELKIIKRHLKKEGFDVRCAFFDIGKLSVLESLGKMTGFMRIYRKAGTVIICSYFLPVASCKKDNRTKVINVWHGCGAMKKFGYDAADDIPKDYVGNPFENTDVMCVSGTRCVEPFTSAISCANTAVLPMGISVTDMFFDRNYTERVRKKFQTLYPDAKGKKVVLWAPTFRENAAKASCFGENYIDELINNEEISREYYIVKSVHPNSARHTSKKCVYDGNGIIYADGDRGKKSTGDVQGAALTTRQLMMCSDILITDYSSVWFEYLLLNRPIIYFAPDYSEYMEKRGMYLDYGELPGVIIKDDKSAAALKKGLMEHSYEGEKLSLLRQKYKELYMNGCDGHATDNLIEQIRQR